jgi:hypothetical protein
MIKDSPRPSPKLSKLSSSDSIDYTLIAVSVAAGLIALIYLILV